MLAAPLAGASDSMLNQVLNAAVKRGLVKAKQHVVCVLSSRGDLVLNVCQVDERGAGLKSNLASLGEQRYAVTPDHNCSTDPAGSQLALGASC